MKEIVWSGKSSDPPSEAIDPLPDGTGQLHENARQAGKYGPNAGRERTPRVSFTNHSSIQRQSGKLKLARTIEINPAANAFKTKYFPHISESEWNDWTWQMKNRICTVEFLSRFIDLSREEESSFRQVQSNLPLSVTPYYLSLVDPRNPMQPLRRSVVPTVNEWLGTPGEACDPLGEEGHTVVPGLVHRYPDRVLLLATGTCSTYCRYCTRRRMVAGAEEQYCSNRRLLEQAFDYIAANPAVRDVLISGGDPLVLSDNKLEWILSRLRRIKTVEIIRIGTKAPVVMPQRITPALVRMLRRYHPLFMSIHFTHPDELTEEVSRACRRLADAGIPLGSQTVLLNGINDDAPVLKNLFQGLLRIRVRPYYLYQCDPIMGSGHFRTPVSKGLEIMEKLRGYTTGYAVPTYVIDAPGGGGKIPIFADTVAGRRDDGLILRNYEGKMFVYPDTGNEGPAVH